jgi:glycosyltransferase involved in cell wall biosynthesis
MTSQHTEESRPLVAIIANVQTPYRTHLHRRLIREVPEVRIASLFTHEVPDQPWDPQLDDSINGVQFGAGEPVMEQGRIHAIGQELRKFRRLTAWLKEHQARAVLLGGYNDVARLLIIAWCRRWRIPCFVFGDSNVHGDRSSGLRRVIKRVIVGWVVRNTSGLLPYGSCGTRYFASYGASPDKIFLHPCEPDYDLIADVREQEVLDVHTRFGLRPGARRIVVCARLLDWKRIDLAIDAFAVIAKSRLNWDLVIVGDGPMRSSLEGRVPHELRHRVQWTGFIGDQRVINAVYSSSDLLICSSDAEPWAVVVNEAAAAGLAIVASHVVGAAAELVRDGVNGHLFRAGDLESLSDVLRIATDADRIDALRAESPRVLSEWRRTGDPVAGFRQALESVGIAAGVKLERQTEAAGGCPPVQAV